MGLVKVGVHPRAFQSPTRAAVHFDLDDIVVGAAYQPKEFANLLSSIVTQLAVSATELGDDVRPEEGLAPTFNLRC